MNSVVIKVPVETSFAGLSEEVQADIESTGSISLSSALDSRPANTSENGGEELRLYRTKANMAEIEGLIALRGLPWGVIGHKGETIPAVYDADGTETQASYVHHDKPISFAEIEPYLSDVVTSYDANDLPIVGRPTELTGFHKESGTGAWAIVE